MWGKLKQALDEYTVVYPAARNPYNQSSFVFSDPAYSEQSGGETIKRRKTIKKKDDNGVVDSAKQYRPQAQA